MKTEHLDAYLSGDLTGESAAFVESALKNDDVLREVYFQQVRMDAALRTLFAAEEDSTGAETGDFATGVMARIRSEAGDEIEEERRLAKSVLTEILEDREARPRPAGWAEWLKAGGIAAAAVVVTVLGFQSVIVNDSRESVVAAEDGSRFFVAQVTAEEGVTWGELEADGAEWRDDGWLHPGRIQLESGVAEITFVSGARIYLEGPAVFDLERPNRGFLQVGKLTAEVPGPASGFVINTPRMNVVDLGTRFGVSVEPNGDSEAHVMEGTVEVSRSAGNAVPMIVNEGLAVRADGRTRSRLRVIEYGGDNFALRVASPQRDVHHYVHYSFDESGGPEIEESGFGIGVRPYDASLFPEDGELSKPMRAPGAVGGGLHFRGGDALMAPSPDDWLADEAFAVCFWIKIPPKSARDSRLAALSLETDDPDLSWDFSWNPDSSTGTVGALRAGWGDGSVVGSTDLRDGRWHHVAIQFIGSEDADLASHVHLYVDGKLETLSGTRDVIVENRVIRRFLMGIKARAATEPVFEGWIDEIYLFRGTVSPLVVQRLAAGEKLP